MFFVRFLADMVPSLEGLRWLTVFGYHDASAVVGHGLQTGPFLALVVFGLACAAVGGALFQRKQLSF